MASAGAVAGIGPPIVGDIEPDALHPLGGVEIARPFPDGDAEVDRVVLRRDAHHLRAAPGDRPHIGVGEMVSLQHFGLGGVDLRDAERHLEVEDLRGLPQAPGMVGGFENMPAIGALAFEDRARIVQPVGQNMHLGVAPLNHMAIHPDPAITIVESLGGHGGFLCSVRAGFDFWRLALHGSRRSDCVR